MGVVFEKKVGMSSKGGIRFQLSGGFSTVADVLSLPILGLHPALLHDHLINSVEKGERCGTPGVRFLPRDQVPLTSSNVRFFMPLGSASFPCENLDFGARFTCVEYDCQKVHKRTATMGFFKEPRDGCSHSFKINQTSPMPKDDLKALVVPY